MGEVVSTPFPLRRTGVSLILVQTPNRVDTKFRGQDRVRSHLHIRSILLHKYIRSVTPTPCLESNCELSRGQLSGSPGLTRPLRTTTSCPSRVHAASENNIALK